MIKYRTILCDCQLKGAILAAQPSQTANSLNAGTTSPEVHWSANGIGAKEHVGTVDNRCRLELGDGLSHNSNVAPSTIYFGGPKSESADPVDG